MKELFLIRDNLANKISYYHLALFVLSLPYDRFYSHLILISFGIHTLLHFKKFSLKPVFNLRTLALQSVFLVTVLSTIYATNKPAAFNEWVLDVPILIMPLLFYINPLDLKKYWPRLLLIFSIGSTATIIYLYFDAFRTLRFYHISYSLIFSPSYTNHNFSQAIDIHATFLSLQIALALVFMLSLFIRERLKPARIFYAFVCFILSAGVIQLSSKSVFVALVLIINIALPLFCLEGIRRRRFVVVSASLTVLLIALVTGTGTFRERYFTELKEDFSHSKNDQSVEPRLMRWELAAGLIRQSPVIGHGAGSEIPLLKEEYFQYKFYISYLNGLNAHNEYLSFLIKSGVLGLAAYLGTLFYGFRMAIRKKDIMLFSLMTLIAIVSLSENILDVDKGVIFYSFFYTLLMFRYEQADRLSLPIKRHKNLRQVATNRMTVTSSI